MRALDACPDSEVVRCSKFYVTPPYGMVEQDDFLNGCLELRTLLSPEELLSPFMRLRKMREESVIHWGPQLDLATPAYDDLVLEREELCIPHVEMHKRKFVLEPLHERSRLIRGIPYMEKRCGKC